ncbi:queuosine precursor transporter [Cetobacterium sp. SF1]|uniref:queuosine precursor transporter n=1 Tax=unclassified Cetobacterium TaxID=2630983 RepID=UPI003CF7F77F
MLNNLQYTNEILWFIKLFISFIVVLSAYKCFGKTGLFIWIPISMFIANIEVIILVKLFGLHASLGNIPYASAFLATDILSEKYGEKDAKKAIWIGFFSNIVVTFMINFALFFIPEADGQQMFDSLKSIFGLFPRFMIAGLIAYGISQHLDVYLYSSLKNKFPNHLWIRNNGSTMISQLVDNILFTVIAFTGVFPISVMFEIFLSTYILKWIVAAMDTPFLYLATKIDSKKSLC